MFTKNKKIWKFLLLFIAAAIIPVFMVSIRSNAAVTLQTGDYVKFGMYDGDPILWRVVNVDGNGPLILSDRILCLKAFDAAGSYYN
ncbi:MAG: hypothetical protein A2Y21_06470 [Clostridiales bacterium GWC2_40_7]|nr:MAG: hypothetical protein A2Y21_06470 [Clostridiales bacterium GWC2_40_7]